MDDPDDGLAAFARAASWIEHSMTGRSAAAISIIAVAMLGFTLLTGRLSVRRAGPIVLGCFILFSARSIAAGLVDLPVQQVGEETIQPVAELPAPAPTFRAQLGPAFDPYEGAAVPRPDAGGHDLLTH